MVLFPVCTHVHTGMIVVRQKGVMAKDLFKNRNSFEINVCCPMMLQLKLNRYRHLYVSLFRVIMCHIIPKNEILIR